jgi:hypothetical protein
MRLLRICSKKLVRKTQPFAKRIPKSGIWVEPQRGSVGGRAHLTSAGPGNKMDP